MSLYEEGLMQNRTEGEIVEEEIECEVERESEREYRVKGEIVKGNDRKRNIKNIEM